MAHFKRYFSLEKIIRDRGLDLNRKDLLGQYTEGMIISLRKLNTAQYNSFCDWLEKAYDINTDSSPENKMRRKIIMLFRKMNYTKGDKVDMDAVHGWVLKYGYKKKPLNDYTMKELPKLVTQAERVYFSFMNSLNDKDKPLKKPRSKPGEIKRLD